MFAASVHGMPGISFLKPDEQLVLYSPSKISNNKLSGSGDEAFVQINVASQSEVWLDIQFRSSCCLNDECSEW